MHINGVYSRLSTELSEAEARIMARLDAVEAKIDRLIEPSGKASSDVATEAAPKKGTKNR